jgi:hypothetical protein
MTLPFIPADDSILVATTIITIDGQRKLRIEFAALSFPFITPSLGNCVNPSVQSPCTHNAGSFHPN